MFNLMVAGFLFFLFFCLKPGTPQMLAKHFTTLKSILFLKEGYWSSNCSHTISVLGYTFYKTKMIEATQCLECTVVTVPTLSFY